MTEYYPDDDPQPDLYPALEPIRLPEEWDEMMAQQGDRETLGLGPLL